MKNKMLIPLFVVTCTLIWQQLYGQSGASDKALTAQIDEQSIVVNTKSDILTIKINIKNNTNEGFVFDAQFDDPGLGVNIYGVDGQNQRVALDKTPPDTLVRVGHSVLRYLKPGQSIAIDVDIPLTYINKDYSRYALLINGSARPGTKYVSFFSNTFGVPSMKLK